MKKFLASSLLLSLSFFVIAQTPLDWHHHAIHDDQVYSDLVKGKTSTTIVVAVIDGGTDNEHTDLIGNIWTNPDEIAGNGIDDDKNGYVDDIHGWSFIGGANGDVNQDNLEITRVLRPLKVKYGDKSASDISPADRAEFDKYIKLMSDYNAKFSEYQSQANILNTIISAIDDVKKKLGKDELTPDDLKNYKSDSKTTTAFLNYIAAQAQESGGTVASTIAEFKDGADAMNSLLNYALNFDFDPRNIVGDNYADITEKFYGNNHVKGPNALHGSHVAGIIGAVRENGIGMDGIAANVKIMVVRCVPDGDERDKDVANAIRYAADNGARVINMSFGKGYAYNKGAVDEAVKYAVSKGVLLVHAAGNDNSNNDNTDNFPNANYASGGSAATWIEVGALSTDLKPAPFSNYGAKSVNVFAPGMEIYSTVADGQYKKEQGTSMASPVVAGVAALVWSYNPSLTAQQIHDILLKSVTKMKGKFDLPGGESKVAFKSLCTTGGIINAYNAMKMALKMSH